MPIENKIAVKEQNRDFKIKMKEERNEEKSYSLQTDNEREDSIQNAFINPGTWNLWTYSRNSNNNPLKEVFRLVITVLNCKWN